MKTPHKYSGVKYNQLPLQNAIDGSSEEIMSSFFWQDMPEGFDYWSTVCHRKKVSVAVRAKLLSIQKNGRVA